MDRCDYLIIGAGIIGVNIAKELSKRFPNKTIVVIDKEGKDARVWAEERGHTDIVTLIEKEDRWRRRRFWVMFSTAFRNAAATEPIGSPAMDMALSLEWVTRIVAGYL